MTLGSRSESDEPGLGRGGAEGRVRTADTYIFSVVLYQAELPRLVQSSCVHDGWLFEVILTGRHPPLRWSVAATVRAGDAAGATAAGGSHPGDDAIRVEDRPHPRPGRVAPTYPCPVSSDDEERVSPRDRDPAAVYDPLWVARAFEEHAADGAYNAHYDRPAVLELLGDVSGKRVLDAACGPGFYAEELLRRGAEVTAFDASRGMIELARQRLGDRVRIEHHRLGDRLPFPEKSFDLLCCGLAIHYADDRRAAFAEFHRMLRPGGAAVVSTTHPTVDWIRKGGSYFEVRRETDVWDGIDPPVEVPWWREPLSSLCGAATDAGFLIQRLVEPLPDEVVRERWPEYWEKLHQRPDFLVLRLLRG